MTGLVSIIWRFIGLSLVAGIPILQEPGMMAHAAGPVLQLDCTLSWNPNQESDLAGYRAYTGRLASQLTQVRDLGLRTTARCSELGLQANGQWYGAVTAYDHSGNESPRSAALPFELAGIAAPTTGSPLSEPRAVHLSVNPYSTQLTWTDPNPAPSGHRIIWSSSNRPVWAPLALLPPGVTQFRYVQPAEESWVCYRIRAEQGALESEWAQATGPGDRQFCFAPAQVPVVQNPIVAATIFPEPMNVRIAPANAGFDISWASAADASVIHRIEVGTSLDARWTTLALLPPGATRFTFNSPVDVDRVCVRIRAEQQQVVSLWAQVNGTAQRLHCFTPGM